MMDGHFSDVELLHKLENDEHFFVHRENILKVDCLIVDEISMLSARLFNQLEYICRSIRNKDSVFGGVQVIVSGDFDQLPPVPNTLNYDIGEFCFTSKAWEKTIRHKFVLHDVVRQPEPDLIQMINEVAKGNVSEGSMNLIKRMARPLPPGPDPVRLCARHFDADVFNFFKLLDVDGDAAIFHATDEGAVANLSKFVVPKILAVKVGCQVMLLKNLSDKLVNGLRGKVMELRRDCITTGFGDIELGLSVQLFSIYSGRQRKVVATRRQFPLCLSYAMTIHKSQGLTYERLEVDGSNIFLPGQLGVAIGRSVKKKGLRIINLDADSILRHPSNLVAFYERQSLEFTDSLHCCRDITFGEAVVIDAITESKEHDDEFSDFSEDEIDEIEILMTAAFTEDQADSLLPIYDDDLPFDPISHLKENCMRITNTQQQKAESERCSMLIAHNESQIKEFTLHINKEITNLIKKSCLNKEVLKSKDWTQYYTELYQYSTSHQYKQMVQRVHPNADSIDFAIIGQIFSKVSTHVLAEASEIMNTRKTDESNYCPSISDAGTGKIRYIGGRCVAKSKCHFMKIGRRCMHVANKRDVSSHAYINVRMLDHLTAKYGKLKDSSKYAESLNADKVFRTV